jgi:hypothetical protein
MARPKKTDDDVRAKNASLRTMLSETRGELEDAEAALKAILTVIGGSPYEKQAREAARRAVEQRRAGRHADAAAAPGQAAARGEAGAEGQRSAAGSAIQAQGDSE